MKKYVLFQNTHKTERHYQDLLRKGGKKMIMSCTTYSKELQLSHTLKS